MSDYGNIFRNNWTKGSSSNFKDASEGLDLDLIEFNNIDKNEINTIISEHLFRNGRFEAGEAFWKEANIELEDTYKQSFRVLDEILSDLGNNLSFSLKV